MTTEDILESFSVNLKKSFKKIISFIDEIDEPDEVQLIEIEKFFHSLKGNSVAFNFNMEFINTEGERLVKYIRSEDKPDIKYLKKEITKLYKEFCQRIK